jgi:hypothetical protein
MGQDQTRGTIFRHSLSGILLLVALVFFTCMNIIYAQNKAEFQTSTGSYFYPDVSLALLLLGTVFLAISAVNFLLIESRRPLSIDSSSRLVRSLGAIIADTIFQSKRIIALVAIIYAVIFAFLDGILIYQPSVDFASSYGISTPSAILESCCGPPGYVPVGLVYFPAEHFGIQLIPISILIMLLISVLVGVNVAFLMGSIEKSKPMKLQKASATIRFGKSSFVGGALGATFGVFAGCPTCAAIFFISMIAGSGATAFSLAISEYQPEIILLSIPLLLTSIWWQARSIRSFLLGCAV